MIEDRTRQSVIASQMTDVDEVEALLDAGGDYQTSVVDALNALNVSLRRQIRVQIAAARLAALEAER